ncbi:YdcF family protein [Paenibacillus sp. TAB 01]|uniref:YdcF family protein n=1 Tax=Paenibacillus sp. TAB 01 TaxID=3368988 RepID=UPI00375014CA
MIRLKRNNGTRTGIRGKALLIFLLILAAGAGWFQWKMISFPDAPYSKADVGIVLGASLWGDVPSPALEERLVGAVALYKDRRISHFIVSGGKDAGGARLSEAEGMRKELVRLGIPDEVITMERLSATTYENLRNSSSLMRDNGWRSAIIITHRYHGVRALDMALFLGYDHPVVSPVDSKVLFLPWHQARETLAMVKWQLQKITLLFQDYQAL